jgi:hypothetical protein
MFDAVADPFPERVQKIHTISLGTIQRIQELRRQGHLLKEIQKQTGASKNCVWNHCRGINPNQKAEQTAEA